jgi:chaperone modulatory protein CbpM
MDNKTILAGVLMDEPTTLSIVEVCRQCNISEDVLLEMLEHGLGHLHAVHLKTLHIDEKTLRRLESASRIQHDLGVNVPGVVLVLELLDELEQLRNELNILQSHARIEY